MADKLTQIKKELNERIQLFYKKLQIYSTHGILDFTPKESSLEWLELSRVAGNLDHRIKNSTNLDQLRQYAIELENLEDRFNKFDTNKQLLTNSMMYYTQIRGDDKSKGLDGVPFDRDSTRKVVDFLIDEIIKLRKEMVQMKNGPIKMAQERLESELTGKITQTQTELTQIREQLVAQLTDRLNRLEPQVGTNQNELSQIREQLSNTVQPDQLPDIINRVAGLERETLKDKLASYDQTINDIDGMTERILAMQRQLLETVNSLDKDYDETIKNIKREIGEIRTLFEQYRASSNVEMEQHVERLARIEQQIDKLYELYSRGSIEGVGVGERVEERKGEGEIGPIESIESPEPSPRKMRPDEQEREPEREREQETIEPVVSDIIKDRVRDLESRIETIQNLYDTLSATIHDHIHNSGLNYGTLELKIKEVETSSKNIGLIIEQLGQEIGLIKRDIVKKYELDQLVDRVITLEGNREGDNQKSIEDKDQIMGQLDALNRELENIKRTVPTVADDIKRKMQQMNATLASVRAEISQQINNEISRLTGIFDGFRRELDQLNQNARTHRALDERVRMLSNVVIAQTKENQKLIDELKRRLDTVQQTGVPPQDNRIDQLRQEIYRRLDVIQGPINETIGQLRVDLQGQIDQLRGQIDTLGRTHQTDTAQLRGQIDALRGVHRADINQLVQLGNQVMGNMTTEIEELKRTREQMRQYIIYLVEETRNKFTEIEQFRQSTMIALQNLSGLPQRVTNLENQTVTDARVAKLEKELHEVYQKMEQQNVLFEKWDEEHEKIKRVQSLLAKGLLAGFGLYL